MIDASNAKVIEQKIDEKTGEVVTIERDAHDLEDKGTELKREAAPKQSAPTAETLLKTIADAKTFEELKAKIAKLV